MEQYMRQSQRCRLEGSAFKLKTSIFNNFKSILLRFFLEELVDYIEIAPKANIASHWKDMLHNLPPPLSEAFKPKSWKHIFTTEAVQNSLARVQIAGYDEKLVKYFYCSLLALYNFFLF